MPSVRSTFAAVGVSLALAPVAPAGASPSRRGRPIPVPRNARVHADGTIGFTG